MNIGTWNVRGLNKKSHQRKVKDFINANQISLLGCLETKVKITNSAAVSKRINRSWRWLFNYEYHNNGRVWFGWDPIVWFVKFHSKSAQHLTCQVTHIEKQLHFTLTDVYAFNKAHERVPLWNNLRLLSQDISSPWVVSGDFNCIAAMEEMACGREQWTPDMQQFKDSILQAGLAHLRTIGPLLTWSNKRPNNLVHRHLDRMLGNAAWLHEFSESWVHVKTKGIMDHTPLLFHKPMQLEKICKPFQFFNFMRDIIGFQEAVMRGWAYTCSGDPMSILCRKLKEVKVELKTLNKQHGNLHRNVSIARTNLQEIQDAIDMDLLNSVLCKSESEAAKNLDKCIQEEENLLQQKARVDWLHLGDNNYKFFFNQTKGRWNRNKILSIENNNGEIVFGRQAVTNVAVEFFSNSLGSPPPLQEIDLRSLQCAQ
ncbi:uncharacterized protein LOC141674337 [Apium graveolens]|uniref:uncharacterized protein LOC141674337 n=1 Tax=Apium graveolens TaxID=4045 RepID=UPI003D7AD14D